MTMQKKGKRIWGLAIVSVFIVIFSTVAVLAYSGSGITAEKIAKADALQKKISEMKNDKQTKALTQEQKAHIDKLKIIRDDVWQDIKNSSNISEDLYLTLEFQQLKSFFSGEFEEFTDKDFLKEAEPIVYKFYFYEDVQVGNTKPFILIKKDMKEILVPYKDKDGNNVIQRAVQENGVWKQTVESKAGKLKMDIADIK